MRTLLALAAVIILPACRRAPPPAEVDAEIALPPTPQAAPALATRKLCEHTCDGDARECRAVAEDDALRAQCAALAQRCKAACR